MKKILGAIAITLASGCYLSRFPITENIAAGSTYRVEGRSPHGKVTALAWVIDHDRHKLVTSAEFCDKVAEPSIVVGPRYYIGAMHQSPRHLMLCEIDSPVELGRALVISRTWTRQVPEQLGIPGSPMWTKHGVVGLVVAAEDGKVMLQAPLTELRSFAKDMHLELDEEPHVEDIEDTEFACPPEAKARGMCVSAKAWVNQ